MTVAADLGSILEPFTRFAVLSAEEQAWLELYSNPSSTPLKHGVALKYGVAYNVPLTEENIDMANGIAEKLPIRRRWRRGDRFGNIWDTRKDRATHFSLTCRFEEIKKELENR
jgi:hypothetical protein